MSATVTRITVDGRVYRVVHSGAVTYSVTPVVSRHTLTRAQRQAVNAAIAEMVAQ